MLLKYELSKFILKHKSCGLEGAVVHIEFL